MGGIYRKPLFSDYLLPLTVIVAVIMVAMAVILTAPVEMKGTVKTGPISLNFSNSAGIGGLGNSNFDMQGLEINVSITVPAYVAIAMFKGGGLGT